MTVTTLLAFDTSGTHCAAALLTGDKIVASRHEEIGRGQAERLFPMLEEILIEAGLSWEDLDAIGVGTGPGNFTGIRISVSAARGLSLSLGIPAIGVSGFEALRGPDRFEEKTPEVVILRTQRGWQLQRFENGDPVGAPVEQPRNADSSAEAASLLGVQVFGYDAGSLSKLIGHATRYESAEFADAPGLRIAERTARVAALKLATGLVIDRPAPLYIRPAAAAPASDPPPVILP